MYLYSELCLTCKKVLIQSLSTGVLYIESYPLLGRDAGAH